jgi:hypothetical protein
MDAMILDLDTLLGGVVSTQAGTTYTLALTDTETTVEFTSASAVTVTVPPNSTAAFDVGSSIELYQYGAGQVTVAPGAGVTIRSPLGRLKLASQYAACALRKRATDEWVLEGDLSA